jgi:hypothetical protein
MTRRRILLISARGFVAVALVALHSDYDSLEVGG